jgi:hypothetical protein
VELTNSLEEIKRDAAEADVSDVHVAAVEFVESLAAEKAVASTWEVSSAGWEMAKRERGPGAGRGWAGLGWADGLLMHAQPLAHCRRSTC